MYSCTYGVHDKQISCIVQILNTNLENEHSSQQRKLLLLLLFLFLLLHLKQTM